MATAITDRYPTVLPSAEALAEAAAGCIAVLAAEALEARGRFLLTLAGGATPRLLYRRLADEPWRGRIDWTRVEILFGDERAVPPDHPDSNYRMAREALLDHVPVPPEQVHRMQAELEDLDQAATRYETLLRRLAPDRPVPRLDLVLLGIGPDGHTASLFPGTTVLGERKRLVAPVRPGEGHDRLSLTYPVLNAARHLLFLVAGEGKAAILRRLFRAADPAHPLPVEGIEPQGEVSWLVDEAAAEGLRP